MDAIKLILYYLAYQLPFIFLATGTDATIALIGGADITANFRPDNGNIHRYVTLRISHDMALGYISTMSSSIKEYV